jgi:hypothetical protein
MQVSSEILNLIFVKIGKQLFKNLHHTILGFIFIPQVFHTYAHHQMGVTLEEDTYNVIVFLFFK